MEDTGKNSDSLTSDQRLAVIQIIDRKFTRAGSLIVMCSAILGAALGFGAASFMDNEATQLRNDVDESVNSLDEGKTAFDKAVADFEIENQRFRAQVQEANTNIKEIRENYVQEDIVIRAFTESQREVLQVQIGDIKNDVGSIQESLAQDRVGFGSTVDYTRNYRFKPTGGTYEFEEVVAETDGFIIVSQNLSNQQPVGSNLEIHVIPPDNDADAVPMIVRFSSRLDDHTSHPTDTACIPVRRGSRWSVRPGSSNAMDPAPEHIYWVPLIVGLTMQ